MRLLMAHLRRVATDERLRSAAVTYGRLDYPRADIYLRLAAVAVRGLRVGGELDVLAGAERLLASGEAKSAMVELDRQRDGDVVDRLGSLGFELVERASGRDRRPTTPTYGLFARA
jgi:hypothetical protein